MTKMFCALISIFLLPIALGGISAAAAPAPAKATGKAKTKGTIAAKAKKKPPDYNAMGTAAFRKSNFAEANKYFQLAVKNDSKNPMSWVNSARVTVAIYGQTEPVDYCDYGKNWIFDTLSLLSRAWDLNPTKAAAALANASEPSFSKFRKRPEFKNWSVIQTLPLKTEIATEAFFAKYNDWLIRKNPLPATVVTFAPAHELTINSADGNREVGTWRVSADHVILETKSLKRTLDLKTDSYIYLGSKSFKIVVLKDNSGSERLLIGPEIADCLE